MTFRFPDAYALSPNVACQTSIHPISRATEGSRYVRTELVAAV